MPLSRLAATQNVCQTPTRSAWRIHVVFSTKNHQRTLTDGHPRRMPSLADRKWNRVRRAVSDVTPCVAATRLRQWGQASGGSAALHPRLFTGRRYAAAKRVAATRLHARSSCTRDPAPALASWSCGTSRSCGYRSLLASRTAAAVLFGAVWSGVAGDFFEFNSQPIAKGIPNTNASSTNNLPAEWGKTCRANLASANSIPPHV